MSVFDLEQRKSIPNGEKEQMTFSAAEMMRRLSALREIMDDEAIDVALLTSYHNVKYFSDFLYTSFGRPYAYVVTPDDHYTVSANIDAGMPWRRSFGENVVYTDWHRDNYVWAIRESLRSRGVAPSRIGVEDDTLALQMRQKFQAAFPDAALLDISTQTMRSRMVKSPEEIDLIKNGARIADLGGQAVREAISAGVTEFEVALAGTDAMVREIARTYPHTEIRDTWVWFQSGINTDGAHNWPTTRQVQRGDILSMNCFPMTSGYYTALERTMFFGEPDLRSLELWNINVDVHKTGLELMKPFAQTSRMPSTRSTPVTGSCPTARSATAIPSGS
jgi:creatinase